MEIQENILRDYQVIIGVVNGNCKTVRLVLVFASPRHSVFLNGETETSNILNVRVKCSHFRWLAVWISLTFSGKFESI